MLLKPENSTDTNELFECHGEYDVYQYNHGFKPINKIDGSTALVNLLGFVEHMDIGVKPNVPTFNFPECKYKFDFTIIYVKEPSNYTTRGLMLGYYNYLVQKNGENK